MKPFLANSAWLLSCVPGHLSFANSAKNIRKAQTRKLLQILGKNCCTEYGRKYSFSSIRTPEEFRRCVPLCEYEDIRPFMEKIADGTADVLFPGLPICFEPTSGTSSSTKLIPYTRELKKEFQAGISPWIFDMFKAVPSMMKGKSYWSVSPVRSEKRRTAGGIKIGFEDDTAYLGSFIGKTIGATLAVPSSVSKLDDTETWRYATLAFLLKAKNLSFISVWNPSFLVLLIESLDKEFQSLTDDIRRGRISNVDGRRESHAAILNSFGKADPGRASELDIIFQSGSPGNSLGKIWPNLKLISCWKDGAAALSAKNLEKFFPGIGIVGKGLISTEGFVSFPVSGASAPVLSVNSHFYEFIPFDAKDSTLFPWELETGRRYSVVITTGGGLYRYKLHDMVEVKGFYKSCPMLEFVERDNGTSDCHGEKLSESQVIRALNEIFRSGIPEFAMLAPDGEPVPDHYTLFLAGQKDVPDKLPESLDKELRKNFHYNYCRELGQLKEPEIFIVAEGAAHAHRCYLRHFASEGISEGDIKPRVLDSDKNWKYYFIGK